MESGYHKFLFWPGDVFNLPEPFGDYVLWNIKSFSFTLSLSFECPDYTIYFWFKPLVLNQVQFLIPRDIWQCLETFLVITARGWCHWHLVAADQDATKHPTIHVTHKQFPSQNVSCVEVEKLCFTWIPLCIKEKREQSHTHTQKACGRI